MQSHEDSDQIIVHCFLPLIICLSVPFQTYKCLSFVIGHHLINTYVHKHCEKAQKLCIVVNMSRAYFTPTIFCMG